jgi:preprotein translocase subunit YajC
MPFDPLTIGMFALLAVLVFVTWRNSRKRKAAAEEQKAQLQPGVEIMTSFGVYGTLKAIDTVANEAQVEIAKNVVIKIHPGAITKVITEDTSGDPKSVEEAMARATAEQEAREAELNVDHAIPAGDPQFGERVEAPAKKPARKAPAKKPAE